ncbi:MAG: purine-nucleoside phosphorylase, partial [candidate division Zixibacteria bacterium]|nr:purine-nucleoside phosphorylase [candidate division Zixibacteria bacterium]
MSDRSREIAEATAAVRAQTDAEPTIGIILGTGLGKLGDGIDVKQT